MKKEISIYKILPVMFGYFVMGFIDIIGVSAHYVKNDFSDLTDSTVNLISLSCFLWFLVLSIPTGMLMNRIGRKNTVLLSFLFHIIAMCLPLFCYGFVPILATFALLGIGNTLLQVALNPLVTNIITNDKLSGTLTLGQFVKAVSSLLGPLLTAWFAAIHWGWRAIFPTYALLSFATLLWLWLTPIHENKEQTEKSASFRATLDLLKDKHIVAFFIGILILVGADVGINITLPKFLVDHHHLSLADAGMGNSIYFLARTVGAFVGGILLMNYSERKFYRYSVWIALLGLLVIPLGNNLWLSFASIIVFGAGYANLFSIIFSLALKRVPDKSNEVSALLIVGIAGGAIVPPVLGLITDTFHTQSAAIIALCILWCYLLLLIPTVSKNRK